VKFILALCLIASTAHANEGFLRFATALTQGALDADSARPVGDLISSQPAQGRWGEDGFACLYEVNGTMVTVFEVAFCSLQHRF
jgi:hypothetical protein